MTTNFILDPIPNTTNYLISKLNENGEIIELGIRTNKELIEKWGKHHSDAELIIEGLRAMSEIELYD